MYAVSRQPLFTNNPTNHSWFCPKTLGRANDKWPVKDCHSLINHSEFCPVALLGAEKDAEEQQRVHAGRQLVVLVDRALLVVTFP